ncbi:MAG TPA: TolC family protein [Lacipirellulaceae bacterium]|jgi:outer membrane protein TolC
MNQPARKFWSLVLSGSVLATGCKPQQPFYCKDGNLSHYLDVATDIEYPDVEQPRLDEVNCALPPLTLKNNENYTMWDLTLEEAVHITLCNSQVMRKLGVGINGSAQSLGIGTSEETLSRNLINSAAVTTTYDPALTESTTGLSVGDPFNGSGVEAALAAFDAQLDSSVTWQKNDRPENTTFAPIGPPVLQQDAGNFTSGITKTTADGSTFSFRNNTAYDSDNRTARVFTSDWQSNFEAGFSHPLLQGAGTQYNRIAGPLTFQQYAAGIGNPIDGVMIARLRTDESLTDFEGGVISLMLDVEATYWELYFKYRDLAAKKLGRDSALETWKKTAALMRTGSRGGSADREAEARSQYFSFRAQVETALTELYRTENRLRYLMGLSMSDGRLIRPADEPTTARVAFDWSGIHCEALTRRVEIRKEKWQVKQRELELIAARNLLLPRLDATGTYRWLGLGDDLINQSGVPFNQPGSSAIGNITNGDFQEWQVGVELSVPIGFRRELSGVRHQELLIARERALLQDLELEVSHQLGDSIRDVDLNYGLAQTNFNRRVAAEKEVQAVKSAYEADRVTLDLLLDAQSRRAQAESDYYRALIDYNKSIMEVHYRKGSLLDYNGIYLAEGPWPGKAYFDALREARKRDAGLYLNYGYTRPNVLSRGPVEQGCSSGCDSSCCPADGSGQMQGMPEQAPTPEGIPTPATVPQRMPSAAPSSDQARGDDLRNSDRSGGTILTPYDRRTAAMSQFAAGSDQQPPHDEHQANYAAATTAADAPIWQWAKR